MQNIKEVFIKLTLKLIYSVAYNSANSLSMMGMYEPECPDSLIK